MLELAKMRAAFEALALREAMPALDARALEELDAILDQESAARGIAVLGTLNLRFHRALTARCGMPRLIDAIGDMHRASSRHLYATWQQLDWQDRSNDEHRNIVRAIRDGDADAACAALSAHILAAGMRWLRRWVVGRRGEQAGVVKGSERLDLGMAGVFSGAGAVECVGWHSVNFRR